MTDLVRVGINSILSSLAGKLSKVNLKGVNMDIMRGRSLGTIESRQIFWCSEVTCNREHSRNQ